MSDDKTSDTQDERLKPGYAENFKIAYQLLCASYHAIDTFRMSLLGLLPLASGAGIFLLLNKENAGTLKEFGVPIGVFGLVVTLGLFSYELHGIKKCGYLIGVGKKMEYDMDIGGQFRSRPQEVAGFIDEPWAASVVYPAVLAAWAYLASVSALPKENAATPILVLLVPFVVFVVFFLVSWFLIRAMNKDLLRKYPEKYDLQYEFKYDKEPDFRKIPEAIRQKILGKDKQQSG